VETTAQIKPAIMTEAPFLLFQSLAVSKTTTIEEVVATNYGSWRSLLNAIKEVQREENSKFSKLNVEKLANLSVPLDAWGTRQLKERSPMFSDEFQRFVSCEEIVKSLVEDLGNLGNGSGENNENLNCGGVGKLVKDTLSSKAQTPTEPPPSSPPIVRKKQSKAVMIEIPIDGECQLDDEKEIEEEEKEEEEEDVFKVSGRVQNTPPQQQQQQHRAAAPQHTRFDSSPESEGGIFEDGEAAEEEEEEEEEEEDILLDTPAAPRQRRDGSMPPPLEAVTVMKPRRESVALTPKQVYESAERLKRLASEKLQKFSVEKQRYGDEEDGLTEGTTTTTMEEAHAAFYQEQVINYLEEFEAVLEKIKGQVAKIKNAPLSLAMAETISVELEIESSIKDIRAEIQAHKK
jgi:hypothetical protein